jgi:cyclophilin family peptidyl-prolyl cis-trans isomerase
MSRFKTQILIFFLTVGSLSGQSISAALQEAIWQRRFDKELFQTALQSETAETRYKALRALAWIADSASIPLLKHHLNDISGPEEMRLALLACGQLQPDSELSASIVYRMARTTSKETLARASRSLQGAEDSLAAAFLLAELRSANGERRRAAANSLTTWAREKRIPGAALPALEANVRLAETDCVAAARVMATLGLPGQLPFIREQIESSPPDCQRQLLIAFRRGLKNLANEKIRNAIGPLMSRQLAALANDPFWGHLLSALRTHENTLLRYQVVRTMSEVEPQSHLLSLRSSRQDSNPHIALQAWEGYLRGVSDSLFAPAVAEALNSEERHIRSLAIQASARLYREYSDSLLNWMENGPVWQRRAALQALAKIAGHEKYLLAALATASPALQIESISLLSEISDLPDSLFIATLDHPTAAVAAIAATTLAGRGSKQAAEQILATWKRLNRVATVEEARDCLRAWLELAQPDERGLRAQFQAQLAQTWVIAEKWANKKGYAPMPQASFAFKQLPLIGEKQSKQFRIKTEKGAIGIKLLADIAPQTVASFIDLVDSGFYAQLPFHRVIMDFVVQGGDPGGTGWGGSGYLLPSEHSDVDFVRGSVGIATAGRDTGGSQFFICHSPQPHLYGRYTVFAKVIFGYDILDTLMPDDKIIEIEMMEEN